MKTNMINASHRILKATRCSCTPIGALAGPSRQRVIAGVAGATSLALVGAPLARGNTVRLAGGCNADSTPIPEDSLSMKAPRDDLWALFRRVLNAAGGGR